MAAGLGRPISIAKLDQPTPSEGGFKETFLEFFVVPIYVLLCFLLFVAAPMLETIHNWLVKH